MGCDTKGIIQTENKDVWNIVKRISKFLETRVDNSVKCGNNYSRRNAHYEIRDWSEYLTVRFQDGDDIRLLHVHFDCDVDNEEISTGSKIIISLGTWGKSDEIIKGILENCRDLGKLYYIYNDCSEEGWKEI